MVRPRRRRMNALSRGTAPGRPGAISAQGVVEATSAEQIARTPSPRTIATSDPSIDLPFADYDAGLHWVSRGAGCQTVDADHRFVQSGYLLVSLMTLDVVI